MKTINISTGRITMFEAGESVVPSIDVPHIPGNIAGKKNRDSCPVLAYCD